MATLTITLDLDNDDFGSHPGNEVCRILRHYTNDIMSVVVEEALETTFRDSNGNTVGKAIVEATND